MSKEDIPAGEGLCRHASWNQVREDWETFLALSPAGCLVAQNGDQVVGTASTVRYGNAFSWIGMVLVDPAFKRQGIGKNLLKEALHILKNEDTVKLDATPQGRELYLQLGFKDEYGLSRMTGSFATEGIFEKKSISIQDAILPEIAAYDRKAFGADREQLLRLLFRGAPQFAFCARGNNKIAGYCLGRNGHRYAQIGPVVADNIYLAQQLVTDALQMVKGTTAVMDVLRHQPEWVRWVESKGFREERPFIRMFLGKNNFQGIVNKQFAIAGPEFG